MRRGLRSFVHAYVRIRGAGFGFFLFLVFDHMSFVLFVQVCSCLGVPGPSKTKHHEQMDPGQT